MAHCMIFPDTVEVFMEQYKVVDTEEVYSNGCEFVPIFRMKQWFEHQNDRMKFVQEAVNTLMNTSKTNSVKDKCFRNAARFVQNAIDGEPQDFELIPVTEWAPVTEQLPEIGKEVLLSEPNAMLIAEYHGSGNAEGLWVVDECHHYLADVNKCAWMPLPEPYQEEGEQDG